jgi:hypothetical protein
LDQSSNERPSNEQSKIVSSTPVSASANKSGLENQTAPLMPNAEANPEFAKWWKRWASRVRRISTRRNRPARRIRIDPRNSDLRVAGSIAAECEFKRYL